jgi:hypothetical protein
VLNAGSFSDFVAYYQKEIDEKKVLDLGIL